LKEDFIDRLIDDSGIVERFDAYIKLYLKNHINNFLRHESLRLSRESPCGFCCPENGINVRELEEADVAGYTAGNHRVIVTDERLRWILDGLTKRKREVMILTEGLGYTNRQTAGMLGITLETVKSTKNRARRDIREMLSGEPS